MVDTVKTRIKASAGAFHEKLWPMISQHLGGGRIVHVESVSDQDFFKQVLDMYGGIDTWHVSDEKSLVRGLATRMQKTRKVFPTITIRYKRPGGASTEIHKRMKSLRQPGQWLHPSIVIQGYFSQTHDGGYGDPRAVAIANMDDVIRVIIDGEKGSGWSDPRDWYLDITSKKWGNSDNTEFAVIPISSLSRLGFRHRWIEF